MNTLFVPTIFIALVLFLIGRRVRLAGQPGRTVAAWSVAATVAALPALLFVSYYAHVLDDAAWFYAARSIPYTELSAAGIGFGTGMLAAAARRWRPFRNSRAISILLPTVLLLCMALVMFVPYAKPILVPITVDLRDRWSDGVCLQSSPSTCGPACTATILREFGVSASEPELAWECFSYGGGTENWYLARALRRRGLTADYAITDPQPPGIRTPSIAGVRLGTSNGPGHFIAILGRDGERYIVGDPLVGRLTMTAGEMRSRYYLTGFFLIVGSNGGYYAIHIGCLSRRPVEPRRFPFRMVTTMNRRSEKKKARRSGL